MNPTQASCPTCGAPISFRPGTMVTVCAYCGTLSARTDRDPKLIGKVGDLVQTGSPLNPGMEGTYGGRSFTVAGRVQLLHPLGGVWDEWYLAFADGTWGWLAEVQGRFYLTFRYALPEGVPSLPSILPGMDLDFGTAGRWAVGESSEAGIAGAQGEIPWEVDLEARYRYVDLSGADGAFATLDYSEDPPLFFAGRQVGLEDLKLRQGATGSPLLPKRLKVLDLTCPQCGGGIPLRAPDISERVACTACGSLLDASQGKLEYLKSLQQGNPRMVIPLGAEGQLRGTTYLCIGFLIRACTVEGETYRWGEFLLMNEARQFAWLVESDGHWNLAVGVPVAEVKLQAGLGNRTAVYRNESYRRFQDVVARVEGVWGEFYWKIEQGEEARVSEFVKPPFSLTREIQHHEGGGSEVNWSHSTYLPPEEVQQGFKLKRPLGRPSGVASNQPNHHWATLSRISTWMVVALGLLVALTMVFSFTHGEKVVFKRVYALPATPNNSPALAASPTAPAATETVFLDEPIEILNSRKNLAVTLESSVANAWLFVDGALINRDTGVVEIFGVENSFYQGRDSDGPWSEGSRKETTFLSSLPAGRYALRISPQWEGKVPPVPNFTVTLRSGVMHWIYPVLAFLFALVAPALQLFRTWSFESRRWAESTIGQHSTEVMD